MIYIHELQSQVTVTLYSQNVQLFQKVGVRLQPKMSNLDQKQTNHSSEVHILLSSVALERLVCFDSCHIVITGVYLNQQPNCSLKRTVKEQWILLTGRLRLAMNVTVYLTSFSSLSLKSWHGYQQSNTNYTSEGPP